MNSRYETVAPLAYDNRGNLPGRESIRRTDLALKIYKEGYAKKITLSGKHSALISYKYSHAQVQKNYLLSQGVPLEDIVMEELSCDTVGQAFFIKREILIPKNWKSILVVTSDYHMPRTKEIFNHIIGLDYKIAYIEASTPKSLSSLSLSIKKVKEKRSLATFQRMFVERTNPGDDNAISRILFTEHPLYKNMNPQQLKA